MKWLTILYAFIGCLGFCFVFHLKEPATCLFASLGGALGWGVFLITGFIHHKALQCFLAALAVSIYSEIMAYLNKKPVTCFIIISILPMVPGSGIYFTMKYCLEKNLALFLQEGFSTLTMAGALAVGMLVVTSMSRLLKNLKQKA